MQQPAPTVWTLSDGHAGNVRQAQALARAMGLAARDITLDARPPWRWLAPRRVPLDSDAFGRAFASMLQTPPSLAIGCGRQAALATRMLRGRPRADGTRTRAVQILDPRIAPAHWDLVIGPEHDALRGGNVIPLLGSLHPVDDAWLHAGHARFAGFSRLPAPRTALLVGGPSAHWRVTGADMLGWLDEVIDDVRALRGSVLATTSRRTPPGLANALRSRLQGVPHVLWSGSADGPNPYAGVLAHAQRIVCTADSVNMLSEACATSLPVSVLGTHALTGRPVRFVESLRSRGRIAEWSDETRAAHGHVEPLRETARVARLVMERLGLG